MAALSLSLRTSHITSEHLLWMCFWPDPCNVCARWPACIHHIIIQHHHVLISFFNLAWNCPSTELRSVWWRRLEHRYSPHFHLSSICPSLVCGRRSSRRLSQPPNVPHLILSFSLPPPSPSLAHLIHTQSKCKTIWKIKCCLALSLPSVFLCVYPPPPSPTCLLAPPQGIVGFRVTGEAGWLNIKLSWELTLLQCPALNVSLFQKKPPPLC